MYWIFAFVTLLDHELASLLSEALESEAVKTYQRMLKEQPQAWHDQPVTLTARSYWKKEGNMWAARGYQEPTMLRDLIEAIGRDELDHVAANSQSPCL